MSARNDRTYSPLTELAQGGGGIQRHILAEAARSGIEQSTSRQRLSLDTISRNMAVHTQQADDTPARELRQRTGWY